MATQVVKQEEKEMLLRSLNQADLASQGGELYPDQQEKYFQLVKDFSVMIPMVRFEELTDLKADIDRMHLGQPITESADEDTLVSETGKPLFDKIELVARKVRSRHNITWEALKANIERGNIEDSVMQAMGRRSATDLEMLAIQGDSAIVATDRVSKLLKRCDGWAKLTDSAHIVDADAANVSKTVFGEMIRALPEQYLVDPALTFFCSRIIQVDWQDTVADRETVEGDKALGGAVLSPFGVSLQAVPLIPSTLAVTVASATPACVIGIEYGPFEIKTGVNDKVKIDINNAGVQTITLTAGVHQTISIAQQINTVFPGIASDDGTGRLKLKSTTTGAASEIDIQSVSLDAYDDLGLTVGVYVGVVAAGSGTRREGSYLWLANPENFIWAMVGQTRILSEYDKDYDRVEVVMYNHVAVAIENLDAIVKCINIRRKTL